MEKKKIFGNLKCHKEKQHNHFYSFSKQFTYIVVGINILIFQLILKMLKC